MKTGRHPSRKRVRIVVVKLGGVWILKYFEVALQGQLSDGKPSNSDNKNVNNRSKRVEVQEDNFIDAAAARFTSSGRVGGYSKRH